MHTGSCEKSLCIVPMCQQGLFLKFHPLCAALCDPTDSQQKCDVKQTAVIDWCLKPVQRERNVSPHQGHSLCTMRSVSHCCMKHMADVCVFFFLNFFLFYSGCGLVYIKLLIIFQRKLNSNSMALLFKLQCRLLQ